MSKPKHTPGKVDARRRLPPPDALRDPPEDEGQKSRDLFKPKGKPPPILAKAEVVPAIEGERGSPMAFDGAPQSRFKLTPTEAIMRGVNPTQQDPSDEQVWDIIQAHLEGWQPPRMGQTPTYIPQNARIAYVVAMHTGAGPTVLARAMGVSLKQFNVWREKYPAFRQCYEAGQKKFREECVHRAIFTRATGYEYDEVKREQIEILVKAEGHRGKVPLPAMKTTVTTKHVSPSVEAGTFLLQNYNHGLWGRRAPIPSAKTNDLNSAPQLPSTADADGLEDILQTGTPKPMFDYGKLTPDELAQLEKFIARVTIPAEG